jgi:hypothetical protein
MPLKTILRQRPERRGMQAAFLFGCGPDRRRWKAQLGCVRGTAPWHATPTETWRVVDARAPAGVLDAC